MNKKMLITAAVLVVVLAVMLCLVFILVPALQQKQYENQTTTTTATTPAPEKLGTREEQEVLEITVERADESFTFKREAYLEDWVLTKQPDLALNQNMVSSLVSNASSGIVNQDIKGDLTDLGQYGLDQPAATVTIVFSDGEKQTYYLGNLTVTGSSCYAYREGVERVVTVPGNFYEYATSPLYAYAQPKDFSVDGPNATMIRIASGSDILLEAHRLGEQTMSIGDYMITEPYQVLASTEFDTFAEYFSTISLSGMVDVSNDNLQRYGLDTPAYAVTVEYDPDNVGGTGNFTMYIGDKSENEEDYYVTFEGEQGVYTIKTTALDFITQMNAFSLVNRMFMLYAINYVDEVTVHAPDTDAVLTIIQPDTAQDETARATFRLDGAEINRKAGNLWYQSILSITSHGALPKGYTVSGEPEVTIFFKYLSGNNLTENLFEFFPYEKDYYAVRVDGVTQFYCRREKVENMLTTLDQLRAGELDEED